LERHSGGVTAPRIGISALVVLLAGGLWAALVQGDPVVPRSTADVTPPNVLVTSPNGGESWTAATLHNVTWNATDDVDVAAIDILYEDAPGAGWTMIARDLENTGSWSWSVHNTPSSGARVQVRARDTSANVGADSSNAVFTILIEPGGRLPTTLRDFRMPGTQPFVNTTFLRSNNCQPCHGGYNPATEPGYGFKGSMMAQAGRDPLFYACMAIAEQDAPSSGDMCIRCHSPFGWLEGRSNPTDGSALTAADRDGVSCDHCHRMVDPVYKPGVSPVEDVAVLNALPAADRPTGVHGGQYVDDPNVRKRGPYTDANPPHAKLASAFHRSSDICATCHDLSNPVYERTGDDDYAPGAYDDSPGMVASDTHMPIERTFSEWAASTFPGGVYAPEFAGAKPGGIVSTCQDCHMADVVGKGCTAPSAPTRSDLGYHDFTGGNAWMPSVIAALYPSETDPVALAAAATRARGMLAKSAIVDVGLSVATGNLVATVTVTNRTGHKLPTGYPEGRRMWLNVVAYNGSGTKVYESGAYDATTGVLTEDAAARVYEVVAGLSAPIAAAAGLTTGPSFHFVLNDTIYKDNRIPPAGFTNAEFIAFGGRPVEPGHPAPRYADGQNWDIASYTLPNTTRKVVATLRYQTTSKEYVEFLRDENVTNTAGQQMHDLWVAHGKSPPVTMAADSVVIGASDVADGAPVVSPSGILSLAALANPFRETLAFGLELSGPARVTWEVFDVRGRRVAIGEPGMLGAGAQRLEWDGRAAEGPAPAGIYWVRVQAGADERVLRVVRVR
jgi:hypothetical protein